MTPLPRPPLSSLDPSLVAAFRDLIATRIIEAMPNVDPRRGAVGDLILEPAAALAADAERTIELARRSQSVLDIAADPDLTDPELVDAVLANFRVSRFAPTRASGSITIVVSTAAPTTLAAGAVFRVGKINVVTTAVVTARVDGEASTTTTDQILSPIGGGEYAFTAPATTVEPGLAGTPRMGDVAVPAAPPPFFSRAAATADWTGGGDAESTASLIARLREGIAAPTWSNRATTWAMIKTKPEFGDLFAGSFVGPGDPELLRGRSGLTPIASPGMCDVYVRGRGLPSRSRIAAVAFKVDYAAAEGLWVWQTSLDATAAAGVQRILAVECVDANGLLIVCPVVADVRGVDSVAADGRFDDPRDAIGSRFQTITVRFTDSTPWDGPRNVNVVASREADAAALQSFLDRRDVGPIGGGVVVRAALPCDVRLGVSLLSPNAATIAQSTIDAIALNAAAVVNSRGFAGVVTAADVIAEIAALLPVGGSITKIDMLGDIRGLDGESIFLVDSHALTIPSRPEVGVSPATTTFYLDPADVAVTLNGSTVAQG